MALIAAHLNAGHSGGDSVTIGITSPSSPTSAIPPPTLFPSIISLMVSVDDKHHAYFYYRDSYLFRAQELCENPVGRPGLPVPDKPYGFCGRKATLN